MTFENAAGLVRLLLRQSDRHPIRAVGAAELKLYDPRIVRSFRNLGILVEREDLRDDGATVFHIVDDSLVVVDPETGECEPNGDALDVQTFDIDITTLCRTIRQQSNLKGPAASALSERLWRLGRHERRERAVEICLVRRLRDETAQEIVDHVRGAIKSETPIAVVSLGNCEVPATVARQLESLRMAVACIEDLLRDDPDHPFALDLGRIRVPTGPQARDTRLQIDRFGHRVIFENIELDVEPRDFDAFVLLAEEAVAAGGWVPRCSIADAIQSSSGKTSNLEQVDRCINRLRTMFKKQAGVVEVPEKAFIEPPRLSRRPFGLSHAAMAGSSSMA